MKKLENTNDQNLLRRQALDSPLCTLIKKSWREFDEEIKDSRLSEEDVLRYVLWAIEMIKGGEDDIDDCCKELRHSVLSLLREKRIPSEEIDFITNTICAYTLHCLDQAFMYSLRNDLQNVCTIAENNIKKDQIESVQRFKARIGEIMYQLENWKDFQEWGSDYLLSDRFYTTEDAEWMEEEQSKPEKKNLPVIETKVRKRGRPKAIEKSLDEYICEGIDEQSAINLMRSSLATGMGTAAEVGDLIKSAIGKIVKDVVPFNVLKQQFGDLIKCNVSDYNKQVKTSRKT